MTKTPDRNTVSQLGAVLDAVLRNSGLMVPETEEEVRRAEEEMATLDVRLPLPLADPHRVLRRRGLILPPHPLSIPLEDLPIVQALARAAREGRTIDAATEAAMHRDRAQAETENGD